MERKRIVILGILLFFIICIIILTLGLAGQMARFGGFTGQAAGGTTVESISDRPNFTLDPAFIQATPHWILIIAGRKEQDTLIGYIRNTTVSPEKKAAWEATLRKTWAAYPVKAVPSPDGTTLITCDCDLATLKVPHSDDVILREIEQEIAVSMGKSLTPAMTPAG